MTDDIIQVISGNETLAFHSKEEYNNYRLETSKQSSRECVENRIKNDTETCNKLILKLRKTNFNIIKRRILKRELKEYQEDLKYWLTYKTW